MCVATVYVNTKQIEIEEREMERLGKTVFITTASLAGRRTTGLSPAPANRLYIRRLTLGKREEEEEVFFFFFFFLSEWGENVS